MINFKKILGADFRRKMRYVLSFLPDKAFLRLHYYLTTGKAKNFKNPIGFNEKMQWLKVNDKRPEYSRLVDKLAVREHIAEVLGEEYLFPLLGKWESFDDIDSSDWCHPYVCAAISAGIVNGVDAANFGKGMVITREEMATMTYRAVNTVGKSLSGADREEFADVSNQKVSALLKKLVDRDSVKKFTDKRKSYFHLA